MRRPWTGILHKERLRNGMTVRVVQGTSVNEEQYAELSEFFRLVFDGRWPSHEISVPAAEHLKWKLEGPLPGRSGYLMFGEMDGRIVASSLQVPQHTLVHGTERVFSLGAEGCTHPDYTRRGFRTAMLDFEERCVRQWVDGVFVVIQNPILVQQMERNDAQPPEESVPRVLFRVFSALRLARARKHSGARMPLPMAVAALTPLSLYGSLTSAFSRFRGKRLAISKVERFDERFDELFADAAKQFELITVRSADYLNWRYDIRAGAFTIFAAEERGDVLGYIVLKVNGTAGT